MASNGDGDERDLESAVNYLDPTNKPEPSAETGPGTHFSNTFDPKLRKNAPQLPDSARAAAPKSATEKLASTDSTMTTAQLQEAAKEGDPNGLLNMKGK